MLYTNNEQARLTSVPGVGVLEALQATMRVFRGAALENFEFFECKMSILACLLHF